MEVFKKISALKRCLSLAKQKNIQIGFVPTMGALHQGHISLVDISKKQNGLTVVSIFVNPTQFGNPEDLKKYPKTLEKDIELLENSGCDIVFIPTVDEIYSKNIASKNFVFGGIEHEMEGEFRNGHFNGVATVIQSFFEIVSPTKAYFGEKDFQQLQIIKKLVEIESIPVAVIGCPIFREKDSLAMSSRNMRLDKTQRNSAPFIYQTLQQAKSLIPSKSLKEISLFVETAFKNHPVFNLEYFTIADEDSLRSSETLLPKKKYRAFIAVFAGEIRLIDNISIS